MSESVFMIREIRDTDNPVIEQIIRSVFHEFDLPYTGTAYADAELKNMSQAYRDPASVYFVLEENKKVVGGAGIRSLQGEAASVCELQKLYFSTEARGKGYGKLILDLCLAAAKVRGYRKCYVETAAVLEEAISLFKLNGFKTLDKPMGKTGHFSCGVWMLRDL